MEITLSNGRIVRYIGPSFIPNHEEFFEINRGIPHHFSRNSPQWRDELQHLVAPVVHEVI